MPIGNMPELAILWPENMVMLSDRNRTLSDNTQIKGIILEIRSYPYTFYRIRIHFKVIEKGRE